MDKKEIRNRVRQMRQQVDKEDALYASGLLAELFFEIPDDRLSDLAGRTVGLYMTFDGEIEVKPLAVRLRERGANTAYPEVRSGKIVFREADADNDDMFVKGSFGIKEPLSDLAEVTPDIIIVPGVAYNDEGVRLGMGGGYYDAYYRENPNALYVGVCYDFQVISDLPFDENDMACDILIPIDTEYDEEDDEATDGEGIE